MREHLFNNLSGLRFWSEEELMVRENIISLVIFSIKNSLKKINPAWRFFQTETPILTPANFIGEEYINEENSLNSDVFL